MAETLENFFKLRNELGPVEDDFMAWRDRERELQCEIAPELAKPDTLERFLAVQRAVGPGEEEFLSERDKHPAQFRDVL